MTKNIYPLDNYTESGNLKAPTLLILILLFLARTWVLLSISLVSQQTGNQLLSVFYPNKLHFYQGLLIGCLVIIVAVIYGRRHAEDKWAHKCWPFCLFMIWAAVTLDCLLQVYYLSTIHFHYSLTASIQLVITVWSLIYIAKSQRFKDSFKPITSID